MSANNPQVLSGRFRGYYPVVIDVETAGFNAKTDALLELAATTLKMDEEGVLHPDKTIWFNIEPFEGANLDPAALEFNGIDPTNPLRGAVSETEAISQLCKFVRKGQKDAKCQRSVIVAHNAAFDLSFVNAALKRTAVKRSPFHPFVTFDTTTLAGLCLGQTVLIKACKKAGIEFNNNEAHSALYDTEKTTELFCYMVNRWKMLGGLESDPSFVEEAEKE
jgi:ribonuclease T